MIAAPLQAYSFQNAVLKSLDGQSLDRLRLRPTALQPGFGSHAIESSHSSLLFPEAGSVGLGIRMSDGNLIETATLGVHSVVNGILLLGSARAVHEMVVRSPGKGFVCSVEDAAKEFARADNFHDLVLASVHKQLIESSQLAACNASHALEQRLCRWLLRCQDEAGSQHIHVTQEGLGEALGVRRTSVSVAMELMQRRQLVRYARGRILLLDRAGLESRTCECYWAMRDWMGRSRMPKFAA